MRRFEHEIADRFSMRLLSAALLLCTASVGCIQVGHDAEVGCLVDPEEPGCQLDGGPTAALRSDRGAVTASSGDGASRRAAAAEGRDAAEGHDEDAFTSDAGASEATGQ